MNKDFPTLKDISPNVRIIQVYYKNEFQYQINNEIQLNNLRIWAVANKQTDNIYFEFGDIIIRMNEKGDLLRWPKDMFDTQLAQIAELIKLRRGETTGKFYK